MDWFMDTGIRVIVIIVVALILFIICRMVIPSIMKRTVTHRMAGEAEEEIQKRTDTLSSILVRIAGIVIAGIIISIEVIVIRIVVLADVVFISGITGNENRQGN